MCIIWVNVKNISIPYTGQSEVSVKFYSKLVS